MDYRQLFSEPGLLNEFLDRFEELASSISTERSGLEALDGGPTREQAAEAAASMSEGTWRSRDSGLEAIIKRFTRPVYLIRESTFTAVPDSIPNSVEVARRLHASRTLIEAAIPSTGRIDVRNHRLSWLGTAWMVGPTIAVTNRHVAEEFARAHQNLFLFRRSVNGSVVQAVIDWRREYLRSAVSRFRVKEVLWIEPDTSFDVALLRIADRGEDDELPPPPISLMSEDELRLVGVGAWVAIIGYPAQDSRNDLGDQQRIFDGIYNVKRLAPGRLTAITRDGLAYHDATTLGGNSGSVLLELSTGKAAALHFGGIEGEGNNAVQAPVLSQIVDDHGT
ncbi:serine protease [Actinomycetospora lutea]|uniref:trypsin-like serine peptidase n=1 Tax=Actinomycetospora lutea TaxID=663604 RepID=UPI002366AAAE|nr:serine protease [Actinomycetospora lutea]MDD7936980.1 serine protease [Actinomycetospora lutea]